jgi:hypothetical protein
MAQVSRIVRTQEDCGQQDPVHQEQPEIVETGEDHQRVMAAEDADQVFVGKAAEMQETIKLHESDVPLEPVHRGDQVLHLREGDQGPEHQDKADGCALHPLAVGEEGTDFRLQDTESVSDLFDVGQLQQAEEQHEEDDDRDFLQEAAGQRVGLVVADLDVEMQAERERKDRERPDHHRKQCVTLEQDTETVHRRWH